MARRRRLRAGWAQGALALLAVVAIAPLACTTEDSSPEVGTSVPATAPSTSTTTTTVPLVPTLSDMSSVSTVGLDTVFFGMTYDEAVRAAGTTFTVTGDVQAACFTAVPDNAPPGLTFAFVDGRVERIDIVQPPIATRSGARVGSTEAQVEAIYTTAIQRQPRIDGQPGNLLVFVPTDEADAQFRLVFTTDGTTVTSYRAGRLPVVELPTPC